MMMLGTGGGQEPCPLGLFALSFVFLFTTMSHSFVLKIYSSWPSILGVKMY